MDSILNAIKKLLGIEQNDTSFDQDIIIHINSALMNLSQLGIGASDGFSITSQNETWSQFLGNFANLEGVKTYVYFKVRLAFDPPATSFTLDAYSRQITELEWRLSVQADMGTPPTI